MKELTDGIKEAVGAHLPGRSVQNINDRGVWERHIVEVKLDGEEIVGGGGKHALEKGRITQLTYDRVVALWRENLDYIKDHQPSLISASPFLWTIYLERNEHEWAVIKLTPMAELMWWDPAYNLAFLQYPPFGKPSASHWEAFLHTYGSEPERKRMLLYLVMQRLCAARTFYKAPKDVYNDAWVDECLVDLDTILDEIERL